jgi:CHAT domain-containing protein
MRCRLTLYTMFFVGMRALSQPGVSDPVQPSPDSIASQHKTRDDAAGFIYTYVDAFLADPVEERLSLLEACDRLIWRPLKTDDEHMAYVIMQCNKGYYASLFGDINKATDAYETAWKIYSNHSLTGFDIIEYCLKPLGNNYSMLGDYQSAANVIRHYMFIAEKQQNLAHLLSAFINLSIVYHDTGEQEQAVALLQRALELRGIHASKKAVLYSNLARNFLDLQREAEALRCASLALQHLKKDNTHEALLQEVNTLKILSLLNLKTGDISKATGFIERAKSVVNKNPSLFRKRDQAKLISEHAGLHAMQHNDAIALQYYQEALTLLVPGYRPAREAGLPDKKLLYPENTLKEIFDAMAGLYSKNDPLKALQCFELSFETEDLLRRTYHYQADRLQQQVEMRNRTGQCLALLYGMFERTQDAQLARQAFQLAERTKAVVLREAIAVNAGRQFIKQDTLLKREHDLTFKKAKLASDEVLEQMKGEAANVAHINALISRQTELSIEIKSLQKQIARKYPQYSAAVNIQPVNVEALQQKLAQEDATLVEYFAGQDVLYAFTVDERSVSFHTLPGKAIYDNVHILNDLFSSASRINNDITLYKRTAFVLDSLLMPAAITTKNLVIVPDGLLSHIPFEALLFQQSSSVDYASLAYLVKKFTIAYAPSAASFAGGKSASMPLRDHRVLAMFPVFRNTGRFLKYSEAEAKSLQMNVMGRFLFHNNATKKAFGERLHDYDIIHLSTHADAGSWLEPPSIAFIDSTLYLPEIYGLQLQPDLMVLSACATGVGKVLRGEGALSLARGFQYAGARNLIFSLWNVNDQSTARLMASFYQHYFDEELKFQSLRQAKLDYLENKEISNFQKSPYFWAAFVYYGEIDHDKSPRYSMIIWVAATVLAFTFLYQLIVLITKRRIRIKFTRR